MSIKLKLSGLIATFLILTVGSVQAETLRLLTWGSYAPDELIEKFEAEYPDIKVEVTYSNNEEMIAKLRATGGAGFDLAQPSHDRIYSPHLEFEIYKPLDLSKIDTSNMDKHLLQAVKDNTTIEGEVYAIPHLWGTSGLLVDKSMASDVKGWDDLCDPAYKGKVSMRLKRTILLGTAFAMGDDPFASYGDLDNYQRILDKVADRLIACKDNVKAYWQGGDDLSAMMLSGEIVASDAWDQTAYKLYNQDSKYVFVPPSTGALAWIDTFAIPRKGEADEAAYNWINFVLRPENVNIMSASTGSIGSINGARDLLPDDKKAAVNAAFTDSDMANLKFFPNIPPGITDLEGKTLEKIKAATGN